MPKMSSKTKTAKVATAAPSGLPPGVKSSNDFYLRHLRIMIYGPSGMGKTFCAATMSEHWPEGDLVGPVELSDCLWLSFDAGATTGFGQYGISVAEISFLDLMIGATHDLMKATKMMVEAAQQMVANHGVKTIVLDTASIYDKHLVDYWFGTKAPLNKRQEVDNFAAWRCIGTSHYMLLTALLKLPVNLIVLCHEKPVNEDDKNTQNKLTALTPVGAHEFIPAISGQSLGYYIQNTDLAVVLLGKQKPGGKGIVRYLSTVSTGGHLAKNRLAGKLAAQEPTNLKMLFDKMRGEG